MARLCAGTPNITVRDNRGLDLRGLRYNRGSADDVATQYVDTQTHNALSQQASSQDPRFFGGATLNFQYTPALSGQVLQTVSVDAGTAKACNDIAGRPIWQHSQGRDAAMQSDNDITVQLCYDALDRPVQRTRVTSVVSAVGPVSDAAVATPIQVSDRAAPTPSHVSDTAASTASPVDDTAVSKASQVSNTSDIWCYGDYSGPPGATYDPTDTSDTRNANLRGQLFQHFDTAGLIDMSALGYAVQGIVLRQDRRFLDVPCDSTTHWTAGSPQALYGLNKQWLEPDSDPDNLYSTRWTYNALGLALTQIDAKGHQQFTAYDCAARKQTTSVTPHGGILTPVCTGISYNAANEIDTRSDANNIQVTYAYEPQTTQRLISITATRVSTNLQALTYTYDGVGNVTSLSDNSASAQVSFFRNRAVTPDRTYTYDALYQLTSASGRENYVNNTPTGTDWPGGQFNPSSTPDYRPYTRSYIYDTGGNLTTIRSSNWSGATPPTRRLVVGNSSNRAVCSANHAGPTQANINTYFDSAGKSICVDANINQPMYWTAYDQLSCVVTTYRVPSGKSADWDASDREQYAYDGTGQRVRKYVSSMAGSIWNHADTRYLPGVELREDTATGENLEVIVLDDGARILNWPDGAGKPSGIPNLQLRYQYSDRQNSCQIETDSAGNVITQEEYYPYGGTAVLASRSNSEVKYKYIRYCGKERDATGLYYYGLRYYQPWIGRWINPDPAGTVDGQNLYRMVRNNPVTVEDRGGLMSDSNPAQAGAGAGTATGTVAILPVRPKRLSNPPYRQVRMLEAYLAWKNNDFIKSTDSSGNRRVTFDVDDRLFTQPKLDHSFDKLGGTSRSVYVEGNWLSPRFHNRRTCLGFGTAETAPQSHGHRSNNGKGDTRRVAIAYSLPDVEVSPGVMVNIGQEDYETAIVPVLGFTSGGENAFENAVKYFYHDPEGMRELARDTTLDLAAARKVDHRQKNSGPRHKNRPWGAEQRKMSAQLRSDIKDLDFKAGQYRLFDIIWEYSALDEKLDNASAPATQADVSDASSANPNRKRQAHRADGSAAGDIGRPSRAPAQADASAPGPSSASAQPRTPEDVPPQPKSVMRPTSTHATYQAAQEIFTLPTTPQHTGGHRARSVSPQPLSTDDIWPSTAELLAGLFSPEQLASLHPDSTAETLPPAHHYGGDPFAAGPSHASLPVNNPLQHAMSAQPPQLLAAPSNNQSSAQQDPLPDPWMAEMDPSTAMIYARMNEFWTFP